MDVISTTTQQARKEHVCNFCNGIISIGSTYRRQVLKYDDLYVWKSHLRCENIAGKLHMWDYCDEGVTNEDFHEGVKEEFYKLQGEQDFGFTKFSEILNYVCDYYKVNDSLTT